MSSSEPPLAHRAHSRRFRFGVGPGHITADTVSEWSELARRVESLGYSTLCLGEHVTMMGPIAACMAAAAATTTLRVGFLTVCNDMRHPALLAQEAATIDALSGGRLELGIGAGWNRRDYDALGMPFDPAPKRIERLAEAITIVKRCFAGEPFDFRGAHYRVSSLTGVPRPAQRPRPPIVVGGGGARILELAAREADIISLNTALRSSTLGRERGATATREATKAKIDLIRRVAGERFPTIELGVYIHHVDLRAGTSDALVRAADMGLSPEQAAESPHVLTGDTAAVIDKLEALRDELGISYISIDRRAIEAMAPVVAALAGR